MATLWVELFIELPRGRHVDVAIYHVMVELASAALRVYFDPSCRVSERTTFDKIGP